MVLGRRAPGGAGVVDEDVDVAELRQRLVGQPGDFGIARAIGGDPFRRDAARLQVACAACSSSALRADSTTRAPCSPSASAICSPGRASRQ
jgi:hypothetical protein